MAPSETIKGEVHAMYQKDGTCLKVPHQSSPSKSRTPNETEIKGRVKMSSFRSFEMKKQTSTGMKGAEMTATSLSFPRDESSLYYCGDAASPHTSDASLSSAASTPGYTPTTTASPTSQQSSPENPAHRHLDDDESCVITDYAHAVPSPLKTPKTPKSPSAPKNPETPKSRKSVAPAAFGRGLEGLRTGDLREGSCAVGLIATLSQGRKAFHSTYEHRATSRCFGRLGHLDSSATLEGRSLICEVHAKCASCRQLSEETKLCFAYDAQKGASCPIVLCEDCIEGEWKWAILRGKLGKLAQSLCAAQVVATVNVALRGATLKTKTSDVGNAG